MAADHIEESRQNIWEGMSPDWTTDPESGRSNSSPAYLALVEAVGSMLDNEMLSLLNGQSGRRKSANFIVAQLAHVHNVGPLVQTNPLEPK